MENVHVVIIGNLINLLIAQNIIKLIYSFFLNQMELKIGIRYDNNLVLVIYSL
jgi:hypothetical protein